MTQKPSLFLLSLCRASCFSQGETLREQVGEPAQRTGFSVRQSLMGETPIALSVSPWEKTALPCLCGSLRQADAASTFIWIIYFL
ncbi:MAG: hypothetical protein V7K97_05685 [Nostoc sp.]|uniref:hypothetical protein n=1 Tax=Nostoc sp. TaxID=1180 RepID=UPI002FF95493